MANIITKALHRADDEWPVNRRLNELNWAHVFDFAIRDSEWFRCQALNPGRWAMGFPGLYILFRTLSEMRPASVLEFGLGESSKLTYQYASHYGAQLTIVEHDPEWRDTFCRTVFDVSQSVQVLPLEIRGKGKNRHCSYRDLIPAISGKKYDLVIVDGPWGSRRHSRDQILDVIDAGLLADRFVILFDDADRRGEKQTIRAVQKRLDAAGIAWVKGKYSGRKDTVILSSPEYRFLTSL